MLSPVVINFKWLHFHLRRIGDLFHDFSFLQKNELLFRRDYDVRVFICFDNFFWAYFGLKVNLHERFVPSQLLNILHVNSILVKNVDVTSPSRNNVNRYCGLTWELALELRFSLLHLNQKTFRFINKEQVVFGVGVEEEVMLAMRIFIFPDLQFWFFFCFHQAIWILYCRFG